jgi:hypothetical protein
MQEVTMETSSATAGHSDCPQCQMAQLEAAENHESGLSFLLALLPVITLTFFGQVGLL